MDKTMTIREALEWGRIQLEKRNLSSSRLDAEALLALALSRDRAYLFAHPEEVVQEEILERFRSWINQRKNHYPIQYLRGFQEFYGRPFTVRPGVLIPRPETELLVETCLTLIGRRRSSASSIRILDIGTGSGCIAITLAAEHPGLEIMATDSDPQAVELAAANARGLLPGRSNPTLFVSDLGNCLASFPQFDFILSNPPYVGWRDSDQVEPSVRLHEPVKAVFSGETGIELFVRIFTETHRLIKPDGFLLLEIGRGQASCLEALAAASGWMSISRHLDLAGIPRCLVFSPLPEPLAEG